MSSMEPEAQLFLKKILLSIFLGLFWLILNTTIGIFFGLMEVNEKISTGNIFFYLFFIISLAALILFYYKTWKRKFPHG
jgi:hypothetical protein